MGPGRKKNRAGGLRVMTEEGARSFLVLLILIWVSHVCSLIKLSMVLDSIGFRCFQNLASNLSFEAKIKLDVRPKTYLLINNNPC